MKNPLVSIIIPTYNRAHLISETLDSVSAQTYENWECIIVDDGSTDTTEDVVNRYVKKDSRFQYHKRPQTHKGGGNGARNYGFELSKGEYVQWFDDDDVMLESFIWKKIQSFSNDIKFVICGGSYLEGGIVTNNLKVFNTVKLFEDYIRWKIQFGTNSIMFAKKFLINKNLFNEHLVKNQEIEYFSRLIYLVQNNEYAIVDVTLFLYRRHEFTKSSSDIVYLFANKESVAFVQIENLKRSIQIKENTASYYLYKKCIKMLFSASRNGHKKNIDFLLNEFKLIFKENKPLYIRLVVFVKIFGCKSKRVENYFKYKNIFEFNGK